ncbi:MAG: nitroreductase family protein [Oceanococcaceae bacterium]
MRNPTDHSIHPLLAERWSPYSFDPDRPVAAADLAALFEAARWAASGFNAQPWRYIVGVKGRDDGLWNRLHNLLVEGNQPWTAFAPVLALGIVQTHYTHNGKPNNTAAHDLGAASAQLTFEASARGLVVHQMGGVQADKAHAAFGLSDDLTVLTALAIGYAGTPADLAEDIRARDDKPRQRLPLTDIVLHGDVSGRQS